MAFDKNWSVRSLHFLEYSLDLDHCLQVEGIVLKLTLPILIANTDSRECNRGAESYVVAGSNFILKIVH